MNLIGGLYLGFSMGYVPVTLQYETYVANCTRYTTDSACSELAQRSNCLWVSSSAGANVGQCFFTDRVVYSQQHDVDKNRTMSCDAFSARDCASNAGCFYDPKASQCKHIAGWSALQEGVFAAMLIIGCMVGCTASAPMVARWPRRRALCCIAVVATLAMVLQCFAWQYNEYGLFVFARFVVGLAGGIGAVLCPMYCGEVAPVELRNAIGVMFQMWLCGGLLLASIVGVGISPESDTTFSSGLVERFHVLNGAGFLCCALLFIGAIALPEPCSLNEYEPLLDDNANGTVQLAHDTDNSKKESLQVSLAVAFFLAANQQLTGINAICTYAPQITQSAGLAPLTGNAIAMAWNFLASTFCVVLARNFPLRRVYLFGAVVVCLACVTTAVSAYPGVIPSPDAKHDIELAGIFLFLLAYECGPGPMFYVLSQSVFPVKYRAIGCSLCNTLQFIWNIVINFGFPLAQQGLSGGKNENQDKGMALCFAIFAAIGFVCTFSLMKAMP